MLLKYSLSNWATNCILSYLLSLSHGSLLSNLIESPSNLPIINSTRLYQLKSEARAESSETRQAKPLYFHCSLIFICKFETYKICASPSFYLKEFWILTFNYDQNQSRRIVGTIFILFILTLEEVFFFLIFHFFSRYQDLVFGRQKISNCSVIVKIYTKLSIFNHSSKVKMCNVQKKLTSGAILQISFLLHRIVHPNG